MATERRQRAHAPGNSAQHDWRLDRLFKYEHPLINYPKPKLYTSIVGDERKAAIDAAVTCTSGDNLGTKEAIRGLTTGFGARFERAERDAETWEFNCLRAWLSSQEPEENINE
jgi:hypothetical protein